MRHTIGYTLNSPIWESKNLAHIMKKANILFTKKALFAAGLALAAMAVQAADYYIVVPFKLKTATPASPAVTLTLNSYALPVAMVGTPYPPFDFTSLLQVTGDPSYTAGQASFNVADGALPPGLSLSAEGVVSGTPSTKNTNGYSFQVQASYKTKSGQQAYTIIVNGAVLQVTSIASGGFHTCAVTTTGGVKCWGSDAQGQLGNNAAIVSQQTPVQVSGLTSGVKSITAGRYHTCAVTASSGVKCWGSDAQGQLGNDAALASQPTPVDVSGLTSGVASVSAGRYHTCAVTTSGGAKCWGYDAQGQLGNDAALANQPTPVAVVGLTTGVARLDAGGYNTCAVTTSGALSCWGDDEYGQLGNDATLLRQPTPVPVSGMVSGVADVSAGDYHTCALTTLGGVKCWGYDVQGQLGNDSAKTNQPTPVPVAGLTTGAASVSAGGYHTCAVTTANGLKCWGYGVNGQLGTEGAFADQPTPVDVSGMTSGVARVSAGETHTCAFTTAGHAKCWGSNSNWQIGNNTASTNQPIPVDVLP